MFAISFMVLTLLQLSLQQGIEVPGILQNQIKQAATLFSYNEQVCDGSRMFSTCGSCNAISICLGNTMEWRYCSSLTPDKPFCNNGVCSATSDSSCWGMYCTGVGYFLDPRSCETYHYWERKDSMSFLYKCPEGYVLNPDTFLCRQKKKEQDCIKVVCNPNEIFSSYGSSKRFFGYCIYYSSPVASSTKMYRCPKGTEFDGKSCVYQCSAEGRFPDSVDERTYYECYYSGDALKATVQVCPYGTSFNRTLFTCTRIPTKTTTLPTSTLTTSSLPTSTLPTSILPTSTGWPMTTTRTTPKMSATMVSTIGTSTIWSSG